MDYQRTVLTVSRRLVTPRGEIVRSDFGDGDYIVHMPITPEAVSAIMARLPGFRLLQWRIEDAVGHVLEHHIC